MTRDLLTSLWVARDLPTLTPRDWELLLAQARRCRLHARVAQLFQDRGWWVDVPEGPRNHLQSALVAAERQRNQVRWEVDRVRVALGDVPGPVVLLKGGAYVLLGLPPARGRLFTDVDILVGRDHIGAAEMSLLGAGWVHEQLDAYDARYYRQWMHELPPLKHVWRHTWLDVHHTITPPTSRFPVDGNALLSRARPIHPGAQLATLDPADMVLHSAVHLMQEGDFASGLRDLLDLNDLLLHFGKEAAFWPQLLSRADTLGIQSPLFHVLQQLARLFGTRPPAELAARADAMGQGFASRSLMPALLKLALRPQHPSCDRPLTGVARWLLFVRSHWLRMPWWQILPHLARKAGARAQARLRPTPEAGKV